MITFGKDSCQIFAKFVYNPNEKYNFWLFSADTDFITYKIKSYIKQGSKAPTLYSVDVPKC